MLVLLQRVKSAKVIISSKIYSAINQGLLVFVGIHKNDTIQTPAWFVNKLLNLRIFEDEKGKMNWSLKDINGEILVVSQFTLMANCLSGRRPDFKEAARGEIAEPIYHQFIEEIEKDYAKLKTGVFGAEMEVMLINDGPVTILL